MDLMVVDNFIPGKQISNGLDSGFNPVFNCLEHHSILSYLTCNKILISSNAFEPC